MPVELFAPRMARVATYKLVGISFSEKMQVSWKIFDHNESILELQPTCPSSAFLMSRDSLLISIARFAGLCAGLRQAEGSFFNSFVAGGLADYHQPSFWNCRGELESDTNYL
jgi:hypothetical protein